jgi:hypothetical protein
LYRQNSDYKDLLQEYRTNYKELFDSVSRITDSVDVFERLNGTVRSKAKACQENIRRAEKGAIKDWKRFVETSKSEGVKVDKVVADIIKDHTTEITVYPYKRDRNMI